MKRRLFLPLLAATILAACSKDDNPTLGQAPRLFTVSVTENPFTDPGGTPTTRGAEIMTESLAAFSMNYEGSKYDFTKTGGTWSTFTWPGVANSTKIDFYAYNAGTFYWNSGAPYLSFTVDANASTQRDLLVATHQQISYSESGGEVSLTFDHACAAIQFNVCKTSGVADKTVVVKSVVLSNVKNQGDYHYATGWSLKAPTTSYTLTTGDITLTTEKQPLPCGFLFLIPQEKSGVTLTVNYTVNDGSPQSHDFNLTGSWLAGHEYTININMGTSIIH
ncbi:MAG: fimbrillin family protein [Bacteroidaceae bacterium]|nr:fimbrillin family protein [Bacteroidaceae bacterium]